MKNLNTHFQTTRLGAGEIKIICISLFFLQISSWTKPTTSELTNIPAYRTDVSQAQTIEQTTITSNMQLSDRVNGVDYIIKSNLTITSGSLEIAPGVTIMFADDAGILVKDDGSLTAIGEDGKEIYFLALSGKRGSWKGITVLNNNSRNILAYCRIEHGGGENPYGQANLIIGDGEHTASAQIHHNNIRTSNEAGILINKGAQATWFASNEINTNTGYPISTHITNAAMLSDGNQFSKNGREFIELTGSGNNLIQAAVNLPNLKEPFALSGILRLGNSVTIEAGTRIYMAEEAQLKIDGESGNGSLNAIGTPSQPILIQGMYNTTGLWTAINFFSSASTANQFEYCQISSGGNTDSGNQGMINFAGSGTNKVTIRNCAITNSASNGIYMRKNSTEYNTDIETSNSFTNNAGANIFFDLGTSPIETH